MKLTQEFIDSIFEMYNQVTAAHKRAPVLAYIEKKLDEDGEIDILNGHPRWSSGIRFKGTAENIQVEFVINATLPESFQKPLIEMKKQFEELI